ncbi:MAG: tail fiber domain-containing protein [Ignavibacteriaceae bacterium]|nr:tail fiber domain-containing protein [Ignavibacteriaceae bacterium]
MKYQKILFAILIASGINLFAQTGSINNTLGTGGSFIVKDGANNYLRVDQVTGNSVFLRNLELGNLDNSILGVGVITKNNKRFLHNYAPSGSEFNNLFIGLEAGNFTMGGGVATYQSSYNVGLGSNSLKSLSTGYSNTAVGSASLYSNTIGFDNAALGYCPLFKNIEGNYNTAIGNYALYENIGGSENTAMGYKTLFNNNSGYSNTAVGWSSLTNNVGGYRNTAVGHASMLQNSSGFYNTAVGEFALSSNSIGYGNCSIGAFTLGGATNSLNTALGYNAGANVTSGANLTLLGFDAQPSTGVAANEVVLGNGSIQVLRCNVQTITSLSDVRDKKNIKDLSIGLDFLMKVKPREFNWDRREWYENGISDGSKIQDQPTAGFIAQEFDSLQTTEHAEWLNLVLKNNPDKWEATYGNLLPVIVKAVQELKMENDQLRSEVDSFNSFKQQLAEIESLKEELVNEINLIKAASESASVKFSSIKD